MKGTLCLQRHRVAKLLHLWHRQRCCCRCCCCLTAWRALGVQRFDQEPGDKPGALWLSSGLFSAAATTASSSSVSPAFFGFLPTVTSHISALRTRLPPNMRDRVVSHGNTMSRTTIDSTRLVAKIAHTLKRQINRHLLSLRTIWRRPQSLPNAY